MSHPVDKAIKARWLAKSVGSTFTGIGPGEIQGAGTGIYADEAPNGVTFSYVVYSHVAHPPLLWTTSARYSGLVVQFAGFDDDRDDLYTAMKILIAAFDFVSLTLDSGEGTILDMRPSSDIVIKLEQRIKLKDIWMAVLQYEINWRRPVNYAPS